MSKNYVSYMIRDSEFTTVNAKKVIEDIRAFYPTYPHVILSLKKVDYIDSSGVSALIKLNQELKNNLYIIDYNERIYELYTIMDISKFLNFYGNIEDAIYAIQQKD